MSGALLAARSVTGGDAAETAAYPSRPEGHCDDDAAWAGFARQYAGQPRSRPDLTDFALANAVFMADRWDLDLIVYQTAAKERIRWLSLRLAEAQAKAELYDHMKAVAEANGFESLTQAIAEASKARATLPSGGEK